MKKAVILSVLINIFLIFSLESFGQHGRIKNDREPDFETAGEQEIYWAKQIFKNDYKKKRHEKFEVSITKVDDLTFKLDTVTFRLIDA